MASLARRISLVGIVSCLILSVQAHAQQSVSPQTSFSHALWDKLLKQHVYPINQGASTAVDYAGFDRAMLKTYLDTTAQVSHSQYSQWRKAEQLAFLINLYNAATVELILTKYPDLKSIKDLGSFFRSPWKKEIVSLFGQLQSLDHIEHELIRDPAQFQEARIHFAVNCASVGCPALRAEAYTADRLDVQLDEQTQQFLTDASRNRITFENGRVKAKLSKIFDWYGDDFDTNKFGEQGLGPFLANYAQALKLSDEAKKQLQNNVLDTSFLSYDWALNQYRTQ